MSNQRRKNDIRDRMAATGENHTTARRAVVGDRTQTNTRNSMAKLFTLASTRPDMFHVVALDVGGINGGPARDLDWCLRFAEHVDEAYGAHSYLTDGQHRIVLIIDDLSHLTQPQDSDDEATSAKRKRLRDWVVRLSRLDDSYSLIVTTQGWAGVVTETVRSMIDRNVARTELVRSFRELNAQAQQDPSLCDVAIFDGTGKISDWPKAPNEQDILHRLQAIATEMDQRSREAADTGRPLIIMIDEMDFVLKDHREDTAITTIQRQHLREVISKIIRESRKGNTHVILTSDQAKQESLVLTEGMKRIQAGRQHVHLTGFAATDREKIVIGRNDADKDVTVNFERRPHWLITGGAGFGKTWAMNSLHHALAERPDLFEVISIDPRGELPGSQKFVTEGRYSNYEQFLLALKPAIDYSRETVEHTRPRLMVLIDNISDLDRPTQMGQRAEASFDEMSMALDRIARLGRSLGINMVITQQHPYDGDTVSVIRNFLTPFQIGEEHGTANFG